MSKNISLLVLAAGMGSRYGGLKQLDALGPNGETILEYSIYDAIQAGFTKVVFIIRSHFEEDFRDKIGDKFSKDVEVCYVHQEVNPVVPGLDLPEREKPWGTSQAVLVARDVVNEPFAVINADDYYGQACFAVMGSFLREEVDERTYSMVGYELLNTLSKSGHVNRGICTDDGDGNLASVVETLKIRIVDGQVVFGEDGQGRLNDDAIVSMNFWGFHQNIFEALERGFHAFASNNRDNPKAEYFIPLIIDELINTGTVNVRLLTSPDKWYGVTYKEDAADVKEAFRDFEKSGKYPSPLWT